MKKIKSLVLIALMAVSISVLSIGCKVQLSPTYSDYQVKQITYVNYLYDSMYNLMINCDSIASYTDCRDFSNYKTGYELVEVYLNNLISDQALRSKGMILKDQAIHLKNMFEIMYSYHAKKGTLTKVEAYGFKTQLDAAFWAILNTENNLNKPDSTVTK